MQHQHLCQEQPEDGGTASYKGFIDFPIQHYSYGNKKQTSSNVLARILAV